MAGQTPKALPLRLVPRPMVAAVQYKSSIRFGLDRVGPTFGEVVKTQANQVNDQVNLAQFLQTHLNDLQESMVNTNGQAGGGIIYAADLPARSNLYQAQAPVAPHIGDLESQPSAVTYDGPLVFDISTLPQGVNQTYVYARWSGWLSAAVAGSYNFQVQANDGVNLFVNRQQVIGALTSTGSINQNGSVALGVGLVPFVVEWQWATDLPMLAVNWTPPGGPAAAIPSSNLSRSVNLPTSGFIIGHWWNGSLAGGWYPGQGTTTGTGDNEVPQGTVDGTNAVFTLAHTPIAGSQHVYRAGLRQTPGSDYTITGAKITFNAGNIPQIGDNLLVDYRF